MQYCQLVKLRKVSEPRYACKGCSDPRWGKVVHLCINECFEKFHTRIETDSESYLIILSKNVKKRQN